jgi:hypothetical protein
VHQNRQCRTPTSTTGSDPNYESLAKLEKEVKANDKSVPSTLGGGNQGHLGLVSSALAYERSAPGTPFVRPALPLLPDPDLTVLTGPQIAEGRHLFAENTKLYQACMQTGLSRRSMYVRTTASCHMSRMYHT